MIPIGNMPPFGKAVPVYTAWNPSDKGASITLSNFNLTAASSNIGIVRSVISKSTGKWYWELTIDSHLASCPGIAVSTAGLDTRPGFDLGSWVYQGQYSAPNGAKIHNGSAVAYGVEVVATNIVGVKLDADAGTVEFLVNNSSQGSITLSDLTPPYYACWGGKSTDAGQVTANFGGTAFAYAVPAGYNSGLYS